MEGTHGELGSGLADGLGSDDSGGFAEFDEAARSQVAAVAHHADTTLGFAGEHGTDFHPLDSGGLNGAGEFFRDLLVDVDDHVAVVVFQFFERDAAHDAVAQWLDDFAGFDDTGDVDAVYRAAVVFADDYVLRHVDQTTSQVAGVGRLESRVGQTFTSAVSRDEVLQHGQSFAEVGRDWRLDDFAGWFGHQSTHAGELADLLFRSAGAGVGHDVNRIDETFLVALLHLAEHFVRNSLGDAGPDFNDLVIAFAVGDGAVEILLLDLYCLLLAVFDQTLFVIGDDHVIDADGKACAGGEAEAQVFDFVEHLDRHFEAEPEVAVADQLTDALLLQQAVDERHACGKIIVQNGTAHRGVQEAALVLHGFGVGDVLIVVGGGQINHFAGIAQPNRCEGFDFAGFKRH